ncbi:MAG: hypothetical protein ACO30K_15645, partial [bacterium]
MSRDLNPCCNEQRVITNWLSVDEQANGRLSAFKSLRDYSSKNGFPYTTTTSVAFLSIKSRPQLTTQNKLESCSIFE